MGIFDFWHRFRRQRNRRKALDTLAAEVSKARGKKQPPSVAEVKALKDVFGAESQERGAAMRAVKAIYEKGKIKLSEKPAEQGPMEVLVVFPEPADDPWDEILNDPTPRPALTKWVNEVKQEIADGKAKRLDVGQL